MRLVAFLLLVTVLTGCAGAPQAPADQEATKRCDRTAALYDRYATLIEKPGLMYRHIGFITCRQGRTRDGQEDLDRAVRLIGFEPPK